MIGGKRYLMHDFSKVPQMSHPRSTFLMPFNHKTIISAPYIYPIFWEYVNPGDTFNLTGTVFGRILSPLTYPIMDNLFLDVHHFFVPFRLLWENWEKFWGYQLNPGDSVDFAIPQTPFLTGYIQTNSIWDYLGIPPISNTTGSLSVASFHGRAYNLIWNYWFRDENLQDSVANPTDDGPDNPNLFNLLPRGKRHDYFTSALPFQQKGPTVTTPLASNAPIVGIGKLTQTFPLSGQAVYETSGASLYNHAASTGSSVADTTFFVEGTAGVGGLPSIYADLTGTTGISITDLRTSIALQQFFEISARSGTRYPEIVLGLYGCSSPDYRFMYPEFLGSHSSMVNINSVAQTSATTEGETPQANLSAFGTMSHHGGGFVHSFTEHGIVMSLASIRSVYTYQRGINRKFFVETPYDFMIPNFCHLSEQAILNREIFATGTATDTQVFGYIGRYDEYRYLISQLSSTLRSTASTSLDAWHLAQNFTTLPTLGDTFIVDNPPMERIQSVNTEGDFIIDVEFLVKAARPMPTYAVPGLRRL